jgi:uncharacterized membrane protein
VQTFYGVVATAFEVIGVGVIAAGFLIALVLAVRSWLVSRNGRTAFTTLRDSFGLVILLGLEVLIASDLVRTVTTTPTLTDAIVLAIIVLIRTVLSFSLQIEIEGVAPWKRALLTAPQQIVRRVRDGRGEEAQPPRQI